MAGFENLSPAELNELLDAPLLVALLVGLADGNFDREERRWAAHLLEVHTYIEPRELRRMFDQILEDFPTKVDALTASFPADAAARNQAISEKLAQVNDILPKIAPQLAYRYYRSLVGLAAETAKASGGFLRIGGVSAAEAKWVKLPMLRPVPRPADFVEPNAEEDAEENA